MELTVAIHPYCHHFLFLLLLIVCCLPRFQEYLQINTSHPTPDYYAAADFIISQSNSISLQSPSIKFVKSRPLILLKWSDTYPSLRSILLNSHTDVVPSEPNKWSHHPFSGHLHPSTGHIYARGSQDMKCVGLHYLEAIRKLKSSFLQNDGKTFLGRLD